MKQEKFCFTEEQRKKLIEAAFKKQNPMLASKFLNRCEDAIAEWRKNWPAKTKMASTRNTRAGLKKVATQLQKLRVSILLLPEGAACAVMVNWNRIKEQPIGDCQKAENNIMCFISDLENIVLDVQQACSSVGGITKECEAELITELADVYAWTFHKLPSTTPEGIFVRFVTSLTGIIKLTDDRPFIPGKDLIATAIRRKSAGREMLVKYPQP